METKIYNQVMEWGLNGVSINEIIKRLKEIYNLNITELELITLIKST
jgi:hypothetical protein